MTNNLQQELSELRRQVQEFETIFANMPIMLWYKDDKNTTLRINDAAANFEGVERSAVEGKSCYDVYPKAQADAFFADDLEVIKSGIPKLNIIEKHVTPTGDEMWVQTGKVPYRDPNGNVVGVVAFAVDITTQKQAEQVLHEQHADLTRKNKQLERIQAFIRSTLERIEDAVQRGADKTEVLQYVRDSRRELTRFDEDA